MSCQEGKVMPYKTEKTHGIIRSNIDLNHTVIQFATIDAILAGLYDGHLSCKKLLEYGNFGVGTLDKLDGEIIVLDEQIYQVKANGKVHKPSIHKTTPFATVVKFRPKVRLKLDPGTDFPHFQEVIDKAAPNLNIFYALKVNGRFTNMKTRSLASQKKPYPPMVQIHQCFFPLENVNGTIVGFRAPDYFKDVTVPGYHLHFLSKDRQHGGHILEFTLAEGVVDIDFCYRFLLILPEHYADFSHLDLRVDRSHELEQVEK
jgi:acetolactate decarboxylase